MAVLTITNTYHKIHAQLLALHSGPKSVQFFGLLNQCGTLDKNHKYYTIVRYITWLLLLYIQTTHPKDTCFKPACFLIILPFIRPFYRLARLAKMAGSNTRDGLTSRGFMGFGNDSSDNMGENGGAANKNAALLMSSNGDKGKSKWGNLMQVSIFPPYKQHL